MTPDPLQRVLCPICKRLLFRAADRGADVLIEAKCNKGHLMLIERQGDAWHCRPLPALV